MHAFVLAGGMGRRLAPISTEDRPKPFIPLLDCRVGLLRQTLSRLVDLPTPLSVGVIGNRRHRSLLAKEIAALRNGPDVRWLVLEPFSRNTGPAIVFAAMLIAKHVPEMPLLFLPSDHLHLHWEAFHLILAEAMVHVQSHADICIFGMPPGNHGLGVGFMCLQPHGAAKRVKTGQAEAGCRKVAHFVEKPDATRLKWLQSEGDVLVNAGMVLARAGVIAETAARVAPVLHAVCARALETACMRADGQVLLEDKAWADCPEVSFDVAVLEKARNIVCCPCDTSWHDVGTWRGVRDALMDMMRYDGAPPVPWRLEAESVLLRGNAGLERVHDALVWAEGNVRVQVKDLSHVVVVANGQDVLVENLGVKVSCGVPGERSITAPWGKQRLLFRSEKLGLQVKLLELNPGARTSLQRHRHRSEWLMVLEGELRLQVEDRVHRISRGEGLHIPCESLHRLENRMDGPAMLLEVQTGSYLGEDDIIRFDDDYGRI